MKEKIYISIVLAVFLLFNSGCSAINTSSPLTNNEITSVNDVITSTPTNDQIVSEQNNMPLSVTYMEYQERYRFVGKSTPLLWMPCESSPKVTDLSNTVRRLYHRRYYMVICYL